MGGFLHHVSQLSRNQFGYLIATEGENLAHQIARPPPGLVDLGQAHLRQGVCADILSGEFNVAQNRPNDVIEIVRNTTRHGPDSLHLLRLTQLGFKRIAVRFDLLAAGQVTRKNGRRVTIRMQLKGHTDLDRNAVSTGREPIHLTQLRMRGELAVTQSLHRIGQKARQLTTQRLHRRTLEQRRRSWVEDGNAVGLIDANDRIQRRIDDRSQPVLAELKLFVFLLQFGGAGPQRPTLGEQGRLVNNNTNEMRQIYARTIDSGSMQVAGNDAVGAAPEYNFSGLA